MMNISKTLVGELDHSPDHHGPFSWRGVHPNLARPWLRQRWGWRSTVCADGRRQSGAAIGDPIRVADPEENPANRHRAVGFTPEQWHYVFTNTFDEQESLALYEQYHVPAPARVFWGGKPTPTSTLAKAGRDPVDYNDDKRAPLLFILG